MTTIFADFNACTADDRIRLDTVGSRQSLADTPVTPGTWVWLTDGDVRAGAQVQNSGAGLVARVAWETLEDVASPGVSRCCIYAVGTKP